MKIKDNELLDRLLLVLLDKWGMDAIMNRLQELSPDHGASPRSKQVTRPKRTKATPTKLVEQLDLPVDSRDALLTLAQLYESKKFLPTAGSIRNFLTMKGIEEQPPKNRSDAFRVVLKLLASSPPAEVHQLVESEVHGGPTRLAPISEAIEAFGQRNRN